MHKANMSLVFSIDGWSVEGCQVSKRKPDYTECSCNHLTHFAVLFDFGSASAEVMMFVCSSGNMSDDVSLWPYLLKGGKISHFYERGCYATLKWKYK